MKRPVLRCPSPAKQGGAVLFVGLMILILLALIGVAGMQTTVLQERMSGNYRTQNAAFQNAEAELRMRERNIQVAARSGSSPAVDKTDCTLFDSQQWSDSRSGTRDMFRRRLNRCLPGQDSFQTGRRVNDNPNDIYAITAVSSENATGTGVSSAAVESIYIP